MQKSACAIVGRWIREHFFFSAAAFADAFSGALAFGAAFFLFAEEFRVAACLTRAVAIAALDVSGCFTFVAFYGPSGFGGRRCLRESADAKSQNK